jgi:DNA mismatch repair protein MutS
VPNSQNSLVPYRYVRRQTISTGERYITDELKQLESDIINSEENARLRENAIFEKLVEQVCFRIEEILCSAKNVAYFDCLLSLAVVSAKDGYTKPTIGKDVEEIKIIEGRHCVVETLLKDETFVPNDTYLNGSDGRTMLITGPNMSGKSTFMRQTAIISIMAQIGCFVPATKAMLPIFDQIFTRIGSSDDISAGQSTFMMEMMEVNYALQNATQHSLILLDEVGRGTATYDGMALAQAIIEYIHENVKAKTLFSTHYHELTNLDQSLPNLFNVHVEAKEDKGKITFFHKVLPGPTDQSYGINVASLAKIPVEVTLRATDILNKLEKHNNYETKLLSKDNYVKPVIINNLDPNELAVLEELKKLQTDDLKPIDALLKLAELKGKLGE